RGVAFNLFADGLDRSMRTQKAIGQRLVFAQQSQQQMFGLDIRRAELAGFITSKEDYSPRLFCVAFEHVPPLKVPSGAIHSLPSGPRSFCSAALRPAPTFALREELTPNQLCLRVSFRITRRLTSTSV